MFTTTSLRRRTLLLVLFAFISTLLLSPFASNNSMPTLLDLQCHLAAIMQAKLAITQGQFPLRVAPLEQNGWLYPFYQFYSSTSYLIAGAVYKWITPQSPYLAFKLLVWLANMLAGIYMYRLCFWYCKSRHAAIIASVCYLLAPYNIMVIIHLANFNEALALGIIPITLFYTLRLLYRPSQTSYLLKASVAWFMLVSVHVITFIFTSLFCALFILFLAIKNRLPLINLITTALAYIFACMMAAWFLAPIIMFAHYTVVASTFNNDVFNSLQIHLGNLISPFYSSHVGPGIANVILQNNPSLGLATILGLGLAIYSLSSASSVRFKWQTPLLILFVCVFVLLWAPIDIWSWLPSQLKVIQYKWRLLNQTMWIGSLLLAGGLCWLFNNALNKIHVVLALLIIIISAGSFFPSLENSSMPADKFVQDTLSYNKDSYLIDIQSYPLHGLTESFNLSTSGMHKQNDLVLNATFTFSHLKVEPSAPPSIVVQGFISKATMEQHKTLSIYANNTFIGKKILQEGAFDWKINLSPTLFQNPKLPLSVKFQTEKVFASSVPRDQRTIPMQLALVQNALDNAIMRLPQSHQYCRHFRTGVVCRIDAAKNIKTLVLPVLYYPNMLEITNNNHIVNYSSILYQGKLLATIHPVAGENIITIDFVGLQWANFVSAIAWAEWLIFIVYLMIRKYTVNRRHRGL